MKIVFIKRINNENHVEKIKQICFNLWLQRQDVIVLGAASNGVCIIWSAGVVRGAVRIVSTSFTLFFSLTTGIIRKLLSITRNKNKKHDKILMMAKSNFDSIETIISQVLIDMEISHKNFNAIIREKRNVRGWKKTWGM